MATRNLTLAIDDELLVEARKFALERRTTVNQLVRDYLASLVSQEERRRRALAHLEAAFDRGVIEIGQRRCKREDLYER